MFPVIFAFILTLIAGNAFSGGVTKIICHRPLGAKIGADIIGEIDTEQSSSVANKHLITAGQVFIKVYQQGEPLVINSKIMAGQSIGASKYMMFAADLRVHSIIVDSFNDDSLLKVTQNGKVIDLPTDCTPAKSIPKKG